MELDGQCFVSAAGEQSSAEVSSNVMTYDPQAIPPENSSFLERNFCCRFRCLLDNSSGFLVKYTPAKIVCVLKDESHSIINTLFKMTLILLNQMFET